jgi:hypothetical protein
MSGDGGGMDRKRRALDRRVERPDREGISRQEINNEFGTKEN